jgi:CubicO group peptidase (beta-lactamase class C family)
VGKLAFFFLAALPAQAGETLEAAVDRLVHAHRASVVGMSVGVAHGDTVLLKGYGRVEHDRDVKPNADSVYEIGSISKVFTGVLLAILVGDGVVRLDQPVQDLLPDSVTVPAFDGRRITLLDLTTHTAALPRMPTNFAPRDFTNPYADYSVERMYAFVSAWKLPYAPGTKYLYSNLGAGFLGHALARRAKKSYEDLLVARIAEPLGMKSTRITLTDEMRRRLAAPHDGSLRPGHMWDIPTLAGAGGIRSTARDMLVFLRSSTRLPSRWRWRARCTSPVRRASGSDGTSAGTAAAGTTARPAATTPSPRSTRAASARWSSCPTPPMTSRTSSAGRSWRCPPGRSRSPHASRRLTIFTWLPRSLC